MQRFFSKTLSLNPVSRKGKTKLVIFEHAQYI